MPEAGYLYSDMEARGMIDVQKVLSNSELFSGLSTGSLSRVVGRLKPVTFARNVVICREGDDGDSMFIIVSGLVTVSSDMGWGQRELARKGPGEVFGEMALISNDVRSATVRAIENTNCLELDRSGFDELLDGDPALAQRIAKIMTRRFSTLVHRTSTELLGAYRALTFALANLTESRDPETGAHLERTRHYCVLLAELLSDDARYADLITDEFIDGLFQAAPLHDIGKVAIPDAILFKPGGLIDGEFERMKSHTSIGATMMERVIRQSGADLFRIAYKICLYHHERWDGTGYPTGISGTEIPLEARIMAIADVYDALRSRRVYKDSIDESASVNLLKGGIGTQFDPDIAAVMIEHIERFEEIYLTYQDEEKGGA